MASGAPDRLSPRAREIVTAAREILEQDGLEAALAKLFGVRAYHDRWDTRTTTPEPTRVARR
jgi:hypothetical protein